MRRVAGKRELQTLQHSPGRRVFFTGEIDVGGAQKGVCMGIFVEGPHKDSGAVRERRRVQGLSTSAVLPVPPAATTYTTRSGVTGACSHSLSSCSLTS